MLHEDLLTQTDNVVGITENHSAHPPSKPEIACGYFTTKGESVLLQSANQRLNSYPPSAAYMRQWIRSALVHIMICRLFGDKPLSKPVLGYCHLGTKKQILVKFNPNTKLFNHENASENNVCEVAALFPGGDKLILVGYFRSRHLFALVLHSWEKCLCLYRDHMSK